MTITIAANRYLLSSCLLASFIRSPPSSFSIVQAQKGEFLSLPIRDVLFQEGILSPHGTNAYYYQPTGEVRA